MHTYKLPDSADATSPNNVSGVNVVGAALKPNGQVGYLYAIVGPESITKYLDFFSVIFFFF